MVQLRNKVKEDKICQVCEKIGYHENFNYFWIKIFVMIEI